MNHTNILLFVVMLSAFGILLLVISFNEFALPAIEKYIKQSIFPIKYIDDNREDFKFYTTIMIGRVKFYTYISNDIEDQKDYDIWMERVSKLAKFHQDDKFKKLCQSKFDIFLCWLGIITGKIKKIPA